MVDESKLDAVAFLMDWKERSERSLKRLRKSMVAENLYRLQQPDSISVQEQFQHITKTSVHCILEMHSKRRQRKYKEDPPDIRSRRFETERKKYSLLLAQVMVRANLPVVALVRTLEDPQSAWIHIFGARRGNTLKNRYKSWKQFEKWLETHRGYLFPKGVKDPIDYIQHRIDEGCGRTIPDSLSAVLTLLEQLGRVVGGSRIHEDPLWRGHIRSWAAELSAEAPAKKPAEMYTVAMVLALELVVVDTRAPVFQRALAWVVLCMTWGAMRCDDVQAVLPHRSMLSNYGLRLVLGRSKTTGPDKMQKEVAVHVHRTASLTGEDWLKTGYDIWDTDQFRFRRGYMVMEPMAGWDKLKRKFVPPNGLSSLISKLLSTLPVPRQVAHGWELMQHQLLLPDGLECHFSGHSPRNFLTSVAATIGFSRDERAFLGRWSMGMVSSEEYVRTSRQVVFRIQKAVNRSIVEGLEEPYMEDEAIQRLCETAQNSGANPNRIKKRHTLMSNWSGRHSLGGIYPTLTVLPDDWQDVDAAEETQVLLDDKIAKLSAKDRQSPSQAAKYFVTISRRTSLRRLHLSGCHVKPDRCCEVVFLDEVTGDDFDSICQSCKRKMLSECGRDEDGGSSSTASSSSTSTASKVSIDESLGLD